MKNVFNPSINDLVPAHNYLFVKSKKCDVFFANKEEDKKLITDSGLELLLPDDEKEMDIKASAIEMSFGEVIAISEEAKEDLKIKKGSIVSFGALAGRDANVQGVEYRILRSTDVISKVK